MYRFYYLYLSSILCCNSPNKHIIIIDRKKEQDHQALLEAKYCTRVAAASRTQKKTQSPCDRDLWPMTLKFNRILEVVEMHVRAKFHRTECSGSWVILGTEKKLRRTRPVTIDDWHVCDAQPVIRCWCLHDWQWQSDAARLTTRPSTRGRRMGQPLNRHQPTTHIAPRTRQVRWWRHRLASAAGLNKTVYKVGLRCHNNRHNFMSTVNCTL